MLLLRSAIVPSALFVALGWRLWLLSRPRAGLLTTSLSSSLRAAFRRLTSASTEESIRSGGQAIDVRAFSKRLCGPGYIVVDNVLGRSAAAAIVDGIRSLDEAGMLRLGKLQHGSRQTTDDATRSDRIGFLEPDRPESCPTTGAVRAYIALADELRARLAEEDPLVEAVQGSLDGCNFMAAVYPGGGARYVKHRDALPYKAGRKLTLIYYLNAGWRPEHGGELRLWPREGDPVVVPPVADRLCAADLDRPSSARRRLPLSRMTGRTFFHHTPPSALSSARSRCPRCHALPSQPLRSPPRCRSVCFVSSLEHEVLPAWRPRYALTTWMFNRRDTALEALAEEMRVRKASGKLDTKSLLAALDADSSSDGGGGEEEEEEEEDEEEEEEEEKEEEMLDPKAARAALLQLLLKKKREKAAARATATGTTGS